MPLLRVPLGAPQGMAATIAGFSPRDVNAVNVTVKTAHETKVVMCLSPANTLMIQYQFGM